MPPVKRGLMRRKCWRGIQQYNPLLRKGGAVGRVYELPKKGGSLIPPRTTHRPLTEGNNTNVTEEIPTSRRHHDKASLL